MFILAITFFPADASARLEEMHFVEEVRRAKYAVVAKPVKIEILQCGLNVRVEVVEDLKGNAPEFIDVGLVAHPSHPVLADRSSTYFMVINEGKVRYGGDVSITRIYDSKEEEKEAEERFAKKEAECDAKLPDHKVNHWIMDEIIQEGKSSWLKKPIYLAVPDNIETFVYRPKDIEIARGTQSALEACFYVEDMFCTDEHRSKIKKEKFQGIGDPNSDLIPSEVRHGNTYYNWEQLRQVWKDAENMCDKSHKTYNEESCKLQNEDYPDKKE